MSEFEESIEEIDEAVAVVRIIPIKFIQQLNKKQKQQQIKRSKSKKKLQKSISKIKALKKKGYFSLQKPFNQEMISSTCKNIQTKRVRFKNCHETTIYQLNRNLYRKMSIDRTQLSWETKNNSDFLQIRFSSQSDFDLEKSTIDIMEETQSTQILFEDGSTFRGKYQNGVIISGEMNFKKSKIKYRGEFFLGKFHGNGQLTFNSGQKVSGEWNQGEIIGKAMIKYPKGQIYYGEIKDFRRHGYGYLFFNDGSKYQGAFNDGEITGFGILLSKEGIETKGYWIQGEYVGQNQYVFQTIQKKATKDTLKTSKQRIYKKKQTMRISMTKIVSIKKII